MQDLENKIEEIVKETFGVFVSDESKELLVQIVLDEMNS